MLINGDGVDAVRLMAECSVDLVLTDPPYSKKTHEGARTSIDRKLIGFNHLDDPVGLFSELVRVSRRWVVSFIDWRHVYELEHAGLPVVRFGIWVKPNGAPQFTGDRPGTGWEAIVFLHRDGVKKRWNGGGRRGVFTCNKVNGIHPTQKPLPLVKELIELFTDPGDLVLDPFAGSGTTEVACIETGRDSVCYEKDEGFYSKAKKRVDDALSIVRMDI